MRKIIIAAFFVFGTGALVQAQTTEKVAEKTTKEAAIAAAPAVKAEAKSCCASTPDAKKQCAETKTAAATNGETKAMATADATKPACADKAAASSCCAAKAGETEKSTPAKRAKKAEAATAPLQP